ncbi:MAG: ATP-binding protein [Thomasclavelia sp.]
MYVSACKQEIFTKIAIQDTGKGIALNRQGLIFSRFYREPEIHDDEGIEFGLYLARKIISCCRMVILKLNLKLDKEVRLLSHLPN